MKGSGFIAGLLCCIFAVFPVASFAHKVSTAYLTLTADSNDAQVFHAQWDIAILDLDFALGIDSNGDGSVTRAELAAHAQAIAQYSISHIDIRGDGFVCPLKTGTQSIDTHTDGAYVVLNFDAECLWSAPQTLEVDYRLFYEIDPSHRGVIVLRAGSEVASGVSAPAEPGINSGGVHIRLPPSDWTNSLLSLVSAGFTTFFSGIIAPLGLLLLLLGGTGVVARKRFDMEIIAWPQAAGMGLVYALIAVAVAAFMHGSAPISLAPISLALSSVGCVFALVAIFVRMRTPLRWLLCVCTAGSVGLRLGAILAPLALIGSARALWTAEFFLGYACAALVVVGISVGLRRVTHTAV